MRITSKRNKGFTLTELLIVIAILAVIATIAVPVVSGLMKKGKDTSEDVNSALYTSIMQKYATEEVGASTLYPRLTTTGVNSEYSVFSAKAGQGVFPGFNIIAGADDSDVVSGIRREAVIAIKAFSDTAVSDEYFIPPPSDSDYEYVYYYLTGQVKKEKRDDLVYADASDYLTGEINVSEYWVYLSRDGGSGAALGGVSDGSGYMFIQVLQYGTGQPVDGATVKVSSGATVFTATTNANQNGFVGFSGIPEGSVQIAVEYNGAVSFPDSRYYSKTGEVIISPSGYEGCQMNSPYIVELMVGSLGSIGFYQETVRWDNGQWMESRERITANIAILSDFSINAAKAEGTERAQRYMTYTNNTNGTQELLIENAFLTIGHYKLSSSAYGYRTYRQDVRAGIYGLDDYSGNYDGLSSPYEFPIVMLSPDGQSVVSGTIGWESANQPLVGTGVGLTGTWLSYTNYYLNARVCLTNAATGVKHYSEYFIRNDTGKYDYEITGLPDGIYEFSIESPYNFVELSDFPKQVTVDGRYVEVSGDVCRNDVSTAYVYGRITYDGQGNMDPVPGATVKMIRGGDPSAAFTLTTNSYGYFYPSKNLECGFYNISITLPPKLGGGTYQYRIFISRNAYLSIQLPVASKLIEGVIIPLDSNAVEVSKTGTLSQAEIEFVRVSSDGLYEYSTVTGTIDGTSSRAAFSARLVPGYYKVRITSRCYDSFLSIPQSLNGQQNLKYYLSSDTDRNNHATLIEEHDSSGHWNECENCERKFDYAEHTASAWTYWSTSYCYKYCTYCKYTMQGPSTHSISSYVSKAATCTADGVRTYYCTKGCGYSYTAKISKSGHVGNGIWVYDNNGTASYGGTHHQNCKNCGTVLNSGSACSRGSWSSNGISNHYDTCSKCKGKRYANHSWFETSRSGYVCTGGTIYYKCSSCGQTKTGSYGASAQHNTNARCSTRHACSWNTYCSGAGTHVWNGYYHILCSVCGRVSSDSKWCAMHVSPSKPSKPCPN